MMEKKRLLDKESMTLKLEKVTKQLISKEQMSRSELSKKRSFQEKGITLIALVVTIIILLILAGVTLNMALSQNGLFSKTKEATEKYKQAQSSEEDIVKQIATQLYSEYVGLEVSGYNPTGDSSTCDIGTETSGYDSIQTFNRESNMKWRVWDFDGTTLRIIGDQTSQQLYLKGATGYNNGVWALDHICSTLYSNNKPGVTVTTLRRSDIQKVSTYDVTSFEFVGSAEKNIKFGTEKNYNGSELYYPKMWKENDQNWLYDSNTKNGIECYKWETIGNDEGLMSGGSENSTNVTLKNNYYLHDYKKNEFINDKYFDMIFDSDGTKAEMDYWVGTRYCCLWDEFVSFGIQFANGLSNENSGHYMNGGYIFKSNDTEREEAHYIRPIASIDVSKCKMEIVTEAGKTVCKLNFE